MMDFVGKLGGLFKSADAAPENPADNLMQLQKLMNLGKLDGCLYRGR